MGVARTPARQRRRPRRGTLDRPIDGRLYRAAFTIVLIPAIILGFTVSRPLPLGKPTLPVAFDSTAATTLAQTLADDYPDRAPGTAGSTGAAQWFSQQLEQYGLHTNTTTWSDELPDLGRVPLENLTVVARGQSPVAIVVMAHRDDRGVGPGANDNASGTAALIELARSYAPPQPGSNTRVISAHTIVFLSTDAGAFGGVGAAHFLATSPYAHHILAVINLDALGGSGPTSLEFGGDTPRSSNASLIATAVARVAEQDGTPPRHIGLLGQLIDLAFPLTLYEQGPFVAAGVPAVTITTGGNRPPNALLDRSVDATKLARLGAAAEELVGSLDQGVTLPPNTSTFVWVGGRVVDGWAIELLLVAVLLPFGAAVVDLFALCRRHRVAFGPALRSLRTRLGYWAFVGIVFTCFRLLGAGPAGSGRPLDPAAPATASWPALVLGLAAVVLVAGWLVARRNLAPTREVVPEEILAGQAVALGTLLVVGLLVVATNPFALLLALPALHLWLWIPQLRRGGPAARLGLFLLGLGGPAIVVLSLAWRYHLGLGAPSYLIALISIGSIKSTALVVGLVGAAAASQLAATAAGRYAPFASGPDSPAPGPLQTVVRTVVLAVRARRRAGATG